MNIVSPTASLLSRNIDPEDRAAASKKTIMVVDDDEMICCLLRRLFVMRGYQLVVATKGQTCMSILQQGRLPDLLIVDVCLQDCDGGDILAFVRNNPRLQKLPVIVMSGLITPEEEKTPSHHQGLGCREPRYLGKPFKPDTLLKAVAEELTLKSD